MKGNPKIALQTLEKAKRVAYNLKSQYKQIDKNISYTKALIIDCKKMNIPMNDVEKLLEQSISSLKNNDYDSSLSCSEKSKKVASKRKSQYYRAEETIEAAEKLISEGEKFLDGTNSRILINKAKETLKNHDYDEAIVLATKAGKNFKILKNRRDKASNIMFVSQQRIDELEKLNIETKEISELLDQAKELFNKGKYDVVGDIGNRIYEMTQNLKSKYHLLDSTTHCSQCGSEIDGDSLFCSDCGSKID